jgi:hypothetical protein
MFDTLKSNTMISHFNSMAGHLFYRLSISIRSTPLTQLRRRRTSSIQLFSRKIGQNRTQPRAEQANLLLSFQWNHTTLQLNLSCPSQLWRVVYASQGDQRRPAFPDDQLAATSKKAPLGQVRSTLSSHPRREEQEPFRPQTALTHTLLLFPFLFSRSHTANDYPFFFPSFEFALLRVFVCVFVPFFYNQSKGNQPVDRMTARRGH